MKTEDIKPMFDELSTKVKLMGDGKFEPLHWAGDQDIAGVLTIIAANEAVKGQAVVIAMMAMMKVMLSNKEEKGAVESSMHEAENQVALVFLAGYHLGKRDAEVARLNGLVGD